MVFTYKFTYINVGIFVGNIPDSGTVLGLSWVPFRAPSQPQSRVPARGSRPAGPAPLVPCRGSRPAGPVVARDRPRPHRDCGRDRNQDRTRTGPGRGPRPGPGPDRLPSCRHHDGPPLRYHEANHRKSMQRGWPWQWGGGDGTRHSQLRS